MQKNNLTTFLSFMSFFLFIFFMQNTYAEDLSLANVSHNLMEPIHVFTDTVYNICYVVAITLFLATIAQYRAYRLSPNQTPLNRPIVLFLLTLSVALIPFIAKFSEAAKYTMGNF